MIVGTGVDIVETSRVRSLLEKNRDRFLNRWYDAQEIDYCESKTFPHLHLAARLAAKEAVFKALRLPKGGPLYWKNIIVKNDEDGIPAIYLTGEPFFAAERQGITHLHLSISHCIAYAIATVTAER